MQTMAINRTGKDDDDGVDEEDGKTLRRKLETALAENRTLKAEKILGSGTFTLVKPEDLVKVEPDKIEEFATALQAERVETQKNLIRESFTRRGLEGDELETAVEDFFGEPEKVDPLERTNDLAALSGGRPKVGPDTSKLVGRDAIRAGLEANEKRRTKRSSAL